MYSAAYEKDFYKKLEEKIQEKVKELEEAKKQIQQMHKSIEDSIKYASLLQEAIISKEEELEKIFKDHFVIWRPKDIVGGDIWLFTTLRHEDEGLLFVIDCTGHGVPGAFVTMLVKSIKREIVEKIKKQKDLEVSTSCILEYFNKTMKKMLRQESKDSLSNAGFDGAIIYYNRREQIIKFSGANTPIFLAQNNEVKIIKGEKYSVGYKQCDINHKYEEKIINVNEGDRIFITTDGYIDQIGGKKGFPFGKKRFMKVLQNNINSSLKDIKLALIQELEKWKLEYNCKEQNDDITVIGVEIPSKSYNQDEEEIFKFEGKLSYPIIAAAVENIGQIEDQIISNKLVTITKELGENIIKFGKNRLEKDFNIYPFGSLEIRYNPKIKGYEVIAKNVISFFDKRILEPLLEDYQKDDISTLKKRIRALRKNESKVKGAGLYKVSKIADKIEYSFKEINQNKFSFMIKAIIYKK